MAISYPITLPAEFKSAEIEISALSAVAVTPSPFTLTEQVQAHQGQQLMATITMPKMKRATAEAVLGALLQLNGREGTMYLGDSANKTPRGVATGVPLLKGIATIRSNDLVTDGWTAGVTGILKAGDWIQIGTGSSRRLHKVLADVNSNGSGEATLLIWPKTRAAHADNTALVVSSPMGVFRLMEPTSWKIDLMKVYGIIVPAVESVNL